jgi:hypothetical protein
VPGGARPDALFTWIARAHGTRPWGRVLDAGTGEHSLRWLASLPTDSLTAVTIERWRLDGLKDVAPGARVVLGQWTDPTLLHGEVFDSVIADYLIGAVDGHAPYFQEGMLRRLRQHCGARLYLVGLEPQPRDGSVFDEVCRTRDAAILLAGDRTYREFPRAVVIEWLERSGFSIVDAVEFPNRVGARFVHGQLDVAVRKVPRLGGVLAAAMTQHIEELRGRALAEGERSWGRDYVIAAEVR